MNLYQITQWSHELFRLQVQEGGTYIDATMALHNAGAVYLKGQHFPPSYRFILPPEEIEAEILSITRQKGLLDKELAYIS